MSECAHCGATDESEHGIVVAKTEQGGDSTCNVCLAEYLRGETTLSGREAEVAALKLQGYGHTRIAELLQASSGDGKPAKSTVDEYSRRINDKAEVAARTAADLERFL